MTAEFVLPSAPNHIHTLCGDDNESLSEKLHANGLNISSFDIFWYSMKKGFTILDNGVKIKFR